MSGDGASRDDAFADSRAIDAAAFDEAAIVRLVHDYVALSRGMCFEAKREFWDARELRPVLAPEEVAAPLVGWDAIERYWGASRGTLRGLATESADVHVNVLGPGLALAAFRQRWTATMAATPPLGGAPLGAEVRTTFVLRRRDKTWRIVASLEAHVDGVAYFRALYRRAAVHAQAPEPDT